ncbi:hypothetical protein HME9302_00345 [Alteripontixanthobacter maritimus]|uniref:Flagella basal body P-ring formation protein FlgA SAF domain-containing protein n=1 Tax=Alteripontixanthobacter maritimus TaxID=2161824 RepID=A0A369Q3Y4_9SPHN|nr:flagella basal body P-ring formation protein FlgA [Alteripontixanthobacter maritimus]RDC59160.1 hypothetical protein HME9302_00345 [Alteripontixanthobacter maritimus]
MSRIITVSLAALGLLSAPLAAPLSAQSGFTDPAAIDAAVASFTGAPIGALGGAKDPVDRRLRLARCSSAPTLDWHTPRRDTVRVECPDPRGWRIFVAVTGGSNGAAQRPGAARSIAARDEPVVKRGEVVTMTIKGRGFSISRQGEALEDGMAGNWIRVRPTAAAGRRTTGNRDEMRGRIVRPGLLEIPLG